MSTKKKVFLYQMILQDLKVLNDKPASMMFNFFFSNSFHIIFWYRISHFFSNTPLKIIARVINAFVRIIYSCDISPFAIIGERVVFMHGFDIVIGSNVCIGNDVKIFNGTTFGNRGGTHNEGQPTIEDNCTIGTGAKILGSISIGRNSLIGANSVVLKNFEPNSTIVGNPARMT